MSDEWTPMLLAINEAIAGMGTFKEPQVGFEELSWGNWQLTRAKRILAAVENRRGQPDAATVSVPSELSETIKHALNYVLEDYYEGRIIEDPPIIRSRIEVALAWLEQAPQPQVKPGVQE